MTLTNVWTLEMSAAGDKSFGKLDKPVKQRVIRFFEERIIPHANPRRLGKPLSGDLAG